MEYITKTFDKLSKDEQEDIIRGDCPSEYELIDHPDCRRSNSISCLECWKWSLEQDRKSDKEKEETMKVEVTRKVEVELEEFWVVRGIHVNMSDKKEVVIEKEYLREPTPAEIAEFAIDNVPRGVDFCSVEHNYRLRD